MPKIIENLKDRLIAEAEKQIEESGYGAVTIRSVAKACGVGVGTVYNYFPSKETLIATHLLVDWKMCVDTLHVQQKAPLTQSRFYSVFTGSLWILPIAIRQFFGTKRLWPVLPVLSASTTTVFARSWLPHCKNSATTLLLPSLLWKAC